MSEFFTSDWHLDHDGMIELAGRPFKSNSQMSECIISTLNSTVTANDTLYYLGDLSMRGPGDFEWYRNLFTNLIRCRNIVMILGNHDRLKPFAYVEAGVRSVHTALEKTIDGIDIVLIHDPSIEAIIKDRPILAGHLHTLIKVEKNVINVAVDVWDFAPVSWNTIKEIINSSKEK